MTGRLNKPVLWRRTIEVKKVTNCFPSDVVDAGLDGQQNNSSSNNSRGRFGIRFAAFRCDEPTNVRPSVRRSALQLEGEGVCERQFEGERETMQVTRARHGSSSDRRVGFSSSLF